MSPTARTLKALRDLGFVADVVERYNSFIKRKSDFIGVFDIICFAYEEGIIGVQVTAGSDHARRRTKILAEPRAMEWLRCGGRIQVRSWSKRGARGKRKRWTERVEEIKTEERNAAERVEA